ncbi:MAG: hypothetical protein KA321_06855 [Pseudomonadales bacterium]|nr:hypothetical protein [Pseudomonadales bacterium]
MTRCPKCGHARTRAESHVHEGICPACGIAYAKWQARRPGAAAPVQATPANAAPGECGNGPFLTRLRLQLLEVPERVEPASFWGRTALLAALALWSAKFILNGIDWESIGGSFLHGANLAFHEFGHLFFRPLGEFMGILGGSLFQVLLPLALLAVFAVRQRDNFAAAVALWWCGQNFVDLAPYIRDAEYRVLPLVGGGGEESHDWGNLLAMLDALDSCYALARSSFTLGALVMVAALAWGAYLLVLQRRRI